MWISIALVLALQAGNDETKTRWFTDFGDAAAQSKSLQRPLLIFARRETCPNCQAMETEVQPAESIKGILAQKFVCVRVDADNPPAGAAKLLARVKGDTLPFYAFTTPAGEFIGGMSGYRNEAVFKADLESILGNDGLKAAGVAAKPSYPEYSASALKGSSKIVVVFFFDQSPATDTVSRALSDPLLRDFRDRLVFTQSEYRKGSDLCSRFDILRAPTLLVLDPSKEKPEEQARGRISGSRSPREMVRDFEEILGGSASTTSKPITTPVPPSGSTPEPELSDDEVDRRFIQARIEVAIDANKRGKKAKAIGILEDLLQSYPKHVLTKNVKALLEELRK